MRVAALLLTAFVAWPATASASPLCPAAERRVGPVEVVALCVDGAELLVERVIDDADKDALALQVRDDLVAVQREFGWTLRGRPQIGVFATSTSYAWGLRSMFGYSQATADWVADNSVAFFEPAVRGITVNWQAVRERRPIAAIRHELTHVVTLEACEPRCDLVPAWLNEGQARLAEATIPGADWRMFRVRYEAASMAATASLKPLARLVTQAQWNGLVDWDGYYKYQQAARATELLREDVGGDAPMARLYARIRRGDDVAAAYAALSGRSFDAFARTLSARMLAAAPPGPAIALIAPGPEGKGVSYLLYGFAPESHAALRVVSRRVNELLDIAVSPQGAHFATIDDTYPPGDYMLSIEGVATVTLTKRGGHPKVMAFD